MKLKLKLNNFTLVELLVVIAIIGILISILMPSLVAAKESAKTAVCLNNQKNIGIAFKAYATRNNHNMVPAGNAFFNIIGSQDYLNAPKSSPYDGTHNYKPSSAGNPFYCPSGEDDRLSSHTEATTWNWINYKETKLPWRTGNDNVGYTGGYDTWYTAVGVYAHLRGSEGNWNFSNWKMHDLNVDEWPSLHLIEEANRAALVHDGIHHVNSHFGDGTRIPPRHKNQKSINVLFYDGHASVLARNRMLEARHKSINHVGPAVFRASRR